LSWRARSPSKPRLLLDEIAGGLTEDNGQLIALVRRIHERGVRSFGSARVHAIMSVADRIIVLNFGQKIADGARATSSPIEVRRV
jgi:branched-chain amino acid transport system ATP-binding protein